MNRDPRSFGPPTEPEASVAKAGEQLKAEATSPAVTSATARIVAGFVAMIVCLLILGVLADAIRKQELNALDVAITPLLHNLASPALDAVMEGFTFVGSDTLLVPLFVIALMGLAWLRRPRREWLFLAVALGGSIAINQTMKVIFQRARPQLAWAHVQPDYSFPSGHSMNSLVFYLSVALLAWVIFGRRTGSIAVAGALLLALAVGTSRIYLGYHYFTDVVGGFTAGLLWLLILAGTFDIAPRVRRRWWADNGSVRVLPGGRPGG